MDVRVDECMCESSCVFVCGVSMRVFVSKDGCMCGSGKVCMRGNL